MKKKTLRLALLVLILPVSSHAQPSTLDGTTWRTMSHTEKEIYITGYGNGYTDGWANAAVRVPGKIPYAFSGHYGADGATPRAMEITAAVDEFYKNPSNLPVCVDHAVDLMWQKLTGNLDNREIAAYRKSDSRYGCH